MMALYGPGEQPITQTMPRRSVMDVYLSLPLPRSSLQRGRRPKAEIVSCDGDRSGRASTIKTGLDDHQDGDPLLDGHARSSRNDDTQKASPILSLPSLIRPPSSSSSSAAMNCCSNGLCAFFLRIWTRPRWRNERPSGGVGARAAAAGISF